MTEKTRSVVKEEQGQEGRKETGLSLLPDSVVRRMLCAAAVFANQGQGCLWDNFSGRGKKGRRGRGK